MKNSALLNLAKWLSFIFGFFGALSLVRAAFPLFNRAAQPLYGQWLNFPFVLSIFWLAICLGLFAFSTFYSKPKTRPIWRKMDYMLLVLLCAAVFYAGALTLRHFFFHLIFMIIIPIVAYGAAMLAFGELFARLRDKTLKPTLYWIGFFRNYKIWRPMGFSALILLAAQLYLLIFDFGTPVRIFSLVTICAMTYFAAYLLNLSNEYAKANEEKIRAERFKTELITNVSHDIKTPLTSIINYVDLLKAESLSGKSAEYVSVLDKKSARLKTLIDDLMEASKAGTGNLRVEIQKINLNEILGQAAAEFEDSFAERELALVIREPESPVIIDTDSRHFFRILENLFSNIAKYSLPGTRVFAEIAPGGLKLQNTAQNPLELHGENLTEQFIRGDTSRHGEGSGLGLYIAKSLTELTNHRLKINIQGDLFTAEIHF
ncbi:MAG: hypothetical protein LBE35_06665 [Clostridiales bacterium]|jgi:signal transduction histidine kinase|nr:hypothetical protein [Clostridiales bacterium]